MLYNIRDIKEIVSFEILGNSARRTKRLGKFGLERVKVGE